MLASVLWGLLFLTGALAVWHAAALLLVHGAAGVIVSPAVQLIIHDMVGPAQLPSAIRLNASSRYLAILLGPAVGGGLMLLLGPGWGVIANLVFYVPFTVFLARGRYTGHAERDRGRPRASLRLRDAWRLLAQVSADPRLLTMLLLGGATSFFVGSAFQAQMPEYAHDLGSDESGLWYSILLAANAAGAILGAVLLESADVFRLTARTAIVCAGAWGITIGLFAFAASYPVAVALLVVAGVFNIAFTSIAQTLVQLLAPPHVRGSVVGIYNTASLGLRAGSGVTVGVLGAVINIHWSLALSAAAVVATAAVLLARAGRALGPP
jgi:MFS family permease